MALNKGGLGLSSVQHVLRSPPPPERDACLFDEHIIWHFVNIVENLPTRTIFSIFINWIVNRNYKVWTSRNQVCVTKLYKCIEDRKKGGFSDLQLYLNSAQCCHRLPLLCYVKQVHESVQISIMKVYDSLLLCYDLVEERCQILRKTPAT